MEVFNKKRSELFYRSQIYETANKFVLLIIVFILYFSNIYKGIFEDKFYFALEIIIYIISIMIILDYLRQIITLYYKKVNKLDVRHLDSSILGLKRISQTINTIVIITSIMYFLGINLSTAIASISIFVMALTLIFKDYISNIISGFYLMFSDNVSLKDYVKIGDTKGRIEDITLMNMKIENDLGESTYISNNLAFTKELINYSKLKKRNFTIDFKININNFHKIENNISEFIDKQKDIEYNSIFVKKVEDNYVFVEISLRLINYNFEREKEIRDILNRKVIDSLI